MLTGVTAVRALVQGLAFVLELAALAALAVWGWRTGGTTAARLALAVATPVLLAVLWGAFLAPRARRRLDGAPLVLAKLVVLCGSGALLAAAGHGTAGAALAVVAAADVLAAAALRVV